MVNQEGIFNNLQSITKPYILNSTIKLNIVESHLKDQRTGLRELHFWGIRFL